MDEVAEQADVVAKEWAMAVTVARVQTDKYWGDTILMSQQHCILLMAWQWLTLRMDSGK